MKNKTLLLAIAALAAPGFLHAQTAAYSTPSGYVTQTLPANTFSVVGFNVLPSPVVTGTVTGVSGATLSDSDVNFTTLLTSGKTYVLDITEGPGTADGTVQEFISWSGSDITLPAAISGIAIGDNYAVRLAPTLQEVFPVGFLAGSVIPGTADKVWVPTGNGSYTKYWYKSFAPNIGWHTTSNGTDDTGLVSGDIPLIYIDAILVEKKGVAKDLVLTGQVKTTGSNALIQAGFNLLAIVSPTGSTLFTSGLSGDIAGSIIPGTADKVWVPTGNGSYTKYWYKSFAPNIGWHTTSNGSDDTGLVTADVPLPAGLFIQRISGSKVISLDVPASYSDL